MEHVLFDCSEHSDERRVLIDSVHTHCRVESRDSLGCGFFSDRDLVESRPIFEAFKAFAKCVLEQMEELNASFERDSHNPVGGSVGS